jgi:Transcriptional regulators
MTRRSQIYDVAAKAGVSIATVSRVINGQGKVRPETESAVRAAMRELDYAPSEIARGLATNSTRMIGLYMTSNTLSIFDNRYWLELLRGIDSVISSSPYSIVIISERLDREEGVAEPKYLDFIRTKRIDALIMNGEAEGSPAFSSFKSLLAEGFPVAFFGRRSCPGGFNVYAHFTEYIYRMLERFRALGHRRIAALVMDTSSHLLLVKTVVERFAADFPGSLEVQLRALPSGGDTQRLADLLDETIDGGGCTGLFVELLSSLPTVLGVLARRGIVVPDEVSIISVEHQGNEGAAFFPAVDCFFVPAFEMGKAAARLLLSHFDKEGAQEDSAYFSPEYCERSSTRAPRGSEAPGEGS